ncbi:cysteine hydrolase family protein [Paenibacillus daejeonensis]|uniref:cysteine hydrolase family protein n=1 Tax=Paenibacillus daejeonensis TaxID=135193 RepID=UPI001FDF5943|nr:cysteine hydrolase [Paenibacillus daejeonensis]
MAEHEYGRLSALGNQQWKRPRPTGAAAVKLSGEVVANPYAWPYDGRLIPSRTALLVLDMQTDFCGKSGYVDRMGYDVFSTARAIEPTRRLLEMVRSIPEFTVIYTREGHRPDLADLAPNKRWRSRLIGAEIGTEGPAGRILVRGEPGWQIVPQLTPLPGETIVDKPGKGSFYGTDLDLILRSRGITHLILTGMTTDVGVQSTMREANDRGYECLILEDCTGATDIDNHVAALNMVTMQGGVFGAVTTSDQLIRVLLRLSLESARLTEGELTI